MPNSRNKHRMKRSPLHHSELNPQEIMESKRCLMEIGFLDEDGGLTPMGVFMSAMCEAGYSLEQSGKCWAEFATVCANRAAEIGDATEDDVSGILFDPKPYGSFVCVNRAALTETTKEI
jgi:hypothetical protein